jgi:hypothetical protein
MSASARADRLEQVESQVSYHRQRLALYVRLHDTPSSPRLRELEDAYRAAQDRLAQCRAAARQD